MQRTSPYRIPGHVPSRLSLFRRFIAGTLPIVFFGAVGLGGIAITNQGCGPAAAAAIVPVVTGGITALACGWNVYTTDTAKSPPSSWEQIALDLASQCGMDVVDIVNLFGDSHPVSTAAKARAADVHAAAMAKRAAVAPAPATSK